MLTLHLVVARDRPLGTHPMAALLLRAVAAHLGVHAVSILPASQIHVAGHIGRAAAVVTLQVWRRHAHVAAAHGARVWKQNKAPGSELA